MLILFIYITSLASNETFNFSLNFKIVKNYLLISILILFIIYILDFKNLIFNNIIFNDENYSLLFYQTSLEKNNFFLNKMYNFPTNIITILLVNYLFLTLIATVKITNIFQGPMRPKNN
jgi:NADH-ubiquinone oxidoreductase chain 6